MPKPKPDSIVRHELVLGRAERQIVRDLQTAYSINRIASPITNMSASGLVVAGSATAEGLEAADEAVASVFPQEWLPYLPPWAQPGTAPTPEQEEQQQASARSFAFSLWGFRRFLANRGE